MKKKSTKELIESNRSASEIVSEFSDNLNENLSSEEVFQIMDLANGFTIISNSEQVAGHTWRSKEALVSFIISDHMYDSDPKTIQRFRDRAKEINVRNESRYAYDSRSQDVSSPEEDRLMKKIRRHPSVESLHYEPNGWWAYLKNGWENTEAGTETVHEDDLETVWWKIENQVGRA